jgi:hypothetical protein
MDTPNLGEESPYVVQPPGDRALDHFIAEFNPDTAEHVLVDDFLNRDVPADLIPKAPP